MEIIKQDCYQNEEEVYESEKLPHDLITMHILTRLPIKSVLEFKLVSKQWYSTLSSYQFCNAHLKLSSLINPSNHNHFVIVQSWQTFYFLMYNEVSENMLGCDKVVLAGSCNGLVCISSLYDFVLWNSVTCRSKKFDSDPDDRLNPSTTCRVSWGFGYVASIDDCLQEIMVHVFSIKSKSWRQIDPKEYEHVLSLRSFKSAVIVSGQRYMFHTNRGVVCDERVNWIVSEAEVKVYWDKFICVMRDCMSIYGANMLGDANVSMYERPRKGYRGKERIRLLRNLGLELCIDLIDLLKDGKFLVLKDNAEIEVVDSSLEPMTYNELMTLEDWGNICFTRHVPSLVTPEIRDSRE
ncbi:hypothetical protein RND81_05G098900 [Saponaria officinalis]|uniref:F-box domain-containing protein n=1 Tax=Saponaria officinalis TaxID=3572 RepID=A0AAW1KVV3_SAPOF